eukprot:4379931-Amphidinium_carterae.1
MRRASPGAMRPGVCGARCTGVGCGRAFGGSCCPRSRGGSGHRQRGARAIMSSAADRWEAPKRGSSTIECNL